MTENIDLTRKGKCYVKPATSYTSTSLHDAVKLRIGKNGLAAIEPQTVPQHFRECCVKYGNIPALVYEEKSIANEEGKTEIVWKTVTYAEYEKNVERAALMLMHVGLQPHTSLGILSTNCPEWFYAELGALMAGSVVAGIYPTNSAEAVHHVLHTSEATVCVVDDAEQMSKVRAVKSRLPLLRAVIQLHGPYDDFVGTEEGYHRWTDLAKLEFSNELRNELLQCEQNVAANECALLIFTSGTVGMPKAVMLSHDSLLYDAKAVVATLPDIEIGNEVVVTYLPLNHVAAQIFDLFLTLESGACVYFADRNALKGTLGKTLIKAKPTRIFAVPRVFEKIKEGLVAAEVKSSILTKLISSAARQAIKQHHLDLMEYKSTSAMKYWLASKITNVIKRAMGLERCKSFLIGGAPTSKELKLFFMGLDMPINELFGLSEASGATNIHVDVMDFNTVGRPIEGIEQKIFSPDSEGHGEICMRGRTCLMGYLGEPEKTKETLKEDGWLHTGDVGYMDADGNLVISGRIKELIITSGGENIPPVHIENLIKSELPGIGNAIVVGDHRKYISVLLTIKTEVNPETGHPLDRLHPDAIKWFESLDLHYESLSDALKVPLDKMFSDPNVQVKPDVKILKSIEAGIKRANLKSISRAQRVQKFSILPHDFSLATGELGPTLKLRRNIVLGKYKDVIDNMYNN